MTVFDLLLPLLTATAKRHLKRGRQNADNLATALLGDYPPETVSGRPGGDGECPQGCVHPVAGEETLEAREETVPVEPPRVFEVYGETIVQKERVRRYSKCIVCGWVIDL